LCSKKGPMVGLEKSRLWKSSKQRIPMLGAVFMSMVSTAGNWVWESEYIMYPSSVLTVLEASSREFWTGVHWELHWWPSCDGLMAHSLDECVTKSRYGKGHGNEGTES
jgi:hypothetical protein